MTSSATPGRASRSASRASCGLRSPSRLGLRTWRIRPPGAWPRSAVVRNTRAARSATYSSSPASPGNTCPPTVVMRSVNSSRDSALRPSPVSGTVVSGRPGTLNGMTFTAGDASLGELDADPVGQFAALAGTGEGEPRVSDAAPGPVGTIAHQRRPSRLSRFPCAEQPGVQVQQVWPQSLQRRGLAGAICSAHQQSAAVGVHQLGHRNATRSTVPLRPVATGDRTGLRRPKLLACRLPVPCDGPARRRSRDPPAPAGWNVRCLPRWSAGLCVMFVPILRRRVGGGPSGRSPGRTTTWMSGRR